MQYQDPRFDVLLPKESFMPNNRLDVLRNFVNTWGVPAVPVIVVLGALFAGMTYIIKSEVADMRNDISGLKGDVQNLTSGSTSTNQRIDGTNQRIDSLLKDALERAFPRSAASKGEVRGSLKQADEILQLAKNYNIKLNPQLVASYGKQVADISNDPAASATGAWRTLINLLNYRAFLNTDSYPRVFEPMSQRKGWQQTEELEADTKGTVSEVPPFAVPIPM